MQFIAFHYTASIFTVISKYIYLPILASDLFAAELVLLLNNDWASMMHTHIYTHTQKQNSVPTTGLTPLIIVHV